MPNSSRTVVHLLCRSVVLLLFVVTVDSVRALDPNKTLNEFGVQVWLTENGLPQNTVQAITQTRDGYLWVGTQDGLARFNGVGFVIFDKENTPQFKSNDIQVLLEDRSGALWIGTSYGLIRLRNGSFDTFTTAEGLPDNAIASLAATADGGIWIATSAGLAHYANNSITTMKVGIGDVQSLFVDRNGVLWIGGSNGVVSLKNDQAVDSTPNRELAERNVSAIVEDQTGRLWFGTDTGVIGFDHDQQISFTTKNGLPDDHVNNLLTDKESCLWVSTSGGLARLRLNSPTVVAVTEGLASNLILTAFEDREGSLWIGTDSGGLNLLRDKKFTTITTRQGLASDLIKSVYQDKSGAVWIGTSGGGLSVLKEGKVTNFSAKEGLVSNVVLSLFGDDKGTMWIGTPDGLNQFKDGRFTTFTVAEGLSSDQVRSIYVDRSGVVWVGTRNGLNKIKEGQFSILTTKDGLADDFIGAIFEDSSGILWVGTRAGLSQLKNDHFTNFTSKDGLSSDVITSLHEDSDHNLWIGTNGGGINRLRDGRFTSYTTRNGLLDNVIYRILEDGQHNLWFSSPKGIFEISLRQLNEFAEGAAKNLSVTSYGTSDGMLSRECSGGGYPAGWKGNDGKLWFSTIKGLAMSVHGGYGIYYDRITLEIQSLERGLDGRALPIEVRAGSLLFIEGNPFDPVTGQFPPGTPTLANPFTGFVLPGAGAAGINIIDNAMQNPMVQQVNIGVERQFGRDYVLRADYLHNFGTHFIIGRTIGAVFNPVVGGTDTITNLESSVRTKYDGLLLSLEKRFAHNYQFRASYTLSKAFNFANDDQIPFSNGPLNPSNLALEYGPTPNDQRHRFTFSGVFDAPYGITLAPIVTLASGVPMDILVPGGAQRIPQLQRNAGGRLFHTGSELNAFIKTINAAGGFAGQPLPLVNDNVRFNDSFSSFDLRVSKVFKLGEQVRLEPLAEVFNLFNVTNVLGTSKSNYSGFSNVLVRDSNDVSSPAFLRSTSFGSPVTTAGGVFGSGGPRAFQFGARVTF